METGTPRGARTTSTETPQQDGSQAQANGPEAGAAFARVDGANTNPTPEARSESTQIVPVTVASPQAQAPGAVEVALDDGEGPSAFPRPNIGIEASGEREVDAEFVAAAGAPTVISLPPARPQPRALLPRIEVDERVGRLVLSVILAILLWFYVITLNNPTISARYTGLDVDVRGTGTNLKVVNEVENVDANVQAQQSILASLEKSDVLPFVDVTGMSAGVHELPVQAEFLGVDRRDISNITFTPARVQVQLEVQASNTVPVEVRTIGNPAFGYATETAQVTPGEVRVSGARDTVLSIKKVVVEVDVADKAVTQQGSKTPVALDAQGRVVEGVTFEPATVQVVMPIKLLLSYRSLPVRVPIEGQPAPGYRVSSITIDPTTVTVCCAPAELLDPLKYLSAQHVEITGTTSSVFTTTELILPEGVQLYAGQTNQITVTVAVEPLETTWQQSVAVTVRGVSPGLGAVVSPDRLELSLSGTLAQLQDISPTDITAVVDVAGRGPGNYPIVPVVTVPQGVTIESRNPAQVTVTLIAPTAEPTRTPTPLPTTTPTSTSLPVSPTVGTPEPTNTGTPTPREETPPAPTATPTRTGGENE